MFSDVTLVFLDRDGILNQKPPEGVYITRWEDFRFLPGVERAIADLNRSGRKVVVVTNQRGLALGRMTQADLDGIHQLLAGHLAQYGAHLDAVYICPHDVGECHCRKPDIGLFERAFADFPAAQPDTSVMIGDSISDIEAASRLGMRSIFVTGNPVTQKEGAAAAMQLATATAASLSDCVKRHLVPASNSA